MWKEEMLNELPVQHGTWRREQLEFDKLNEKVLMEKVKCKPGWKAEEEEECPRVQCIFGSTLSGLEYFTFSNKNYFK